MTLAELQALVEEPMHMKRKTADTLTEPKAPSAPPSGIDSIEHGTFSMSTLDMMKARGTFFVPTLMATRDCRNKLQKGLYSSADRSEGAGRIGCDGSDIREGPRQGRAHCMGTDAASYPHGPIEEFHMMVDRGMRPA